MKSKKKTRHAPSPMTLDVLGRMVADGFDRTDQQFTEVRDQLVRLESRIDSVDSKVDALINATLVDLKKRVTTLEARVGSHHAS